MTVSKDKGKGGVLGEAELNLSSYTENDYKVMKIPLRNCSDPDGYIEVALRGTLAPEKKTPRGGRDSVDAKDQINMAL